jgi:hypothetical protein
MHGRSNLPACSCKALQVRAAVGGQGQAVPCRPVLAVSAAAVHSRWRGPLLVHKVWCGGAGRGSSSCHV